MARLSTVLWAGMVLLVLSNIAQARRRSSRRRGVRRGSQTRVQPWFPRVVEGQRPQEGLWSSEPWTPQQIELQSQNRPSEDPWIPQQTTSSLPEDAWVPQIIQQTQQETTWPQQQTPQMGDCSFNYDEVPENHIHSFLVNPDRREMVYPDLVGRLRLMHIAAGTTVLVSCPGPDNVLVATQRPYVYITCQRSQLLYGKKPVHLADLGCLKKPTPTLRFGRRCTRGARTVDIGWNIRRRLFLTEVSLCFHTRRETTLFAAHKIHGRFIDAKIIEPSRPGFKTNNMFSVRVRTSYTKQKQRALAGRILNSTDYLSTKGQDYLAKGHLAPDADFVLEAEQDATYYYVNTIPQWQAVNNGNWKRLESAVRELAERRQGPLEVWTGTHGILELPDLRSHPTKLFLGLSFNKKVLPVPALLWKVIHDPASHRAIAVIVVNDATGTGTSSSWELRRPPCPDLCSRLSWVDWDTSDVSRGLTFCCTVNALKTTIPYLPALGPVGTLYW